MTTQPDTAPPDTDQHDDGDDPDGLARIAVHWIDADDQGLDFGASLTGTSARDPEAFAVALIRAMLGLATAIGPDHAIALEARLVTFDGSRR